MHILLFLLLTITSSVHSYSVRGHELVFNQTKGTRRSLLPERLDHLWYVQSGSEPPPGCIAHEAVAPGVYLARGDASIEMPRGRWTSEMKYDPKMRTNAPPRFPHFGVQVRTDADFFEVDGCKTEFSGRGRFYVSCSENKLEELAEDSRVLWISVIPIIKRHSYEARNLMMGNSNLNGSGIRVAISDTGMDWKHCAFYEGSTPPFGSVTSSRAKIVGILKVNGADYVATTGAHGTATAGVAAGYACLSERTGVAPLAKIWFLDNSDDQNDRYVYVPSNLETLIINSGASVHSASWGAYSGGAYDDLDSRVDAMQRSNPTLCQVRSAGNDGPTGKVSATSKNGLVVGACLSSASDYPDFDTSNADLYSYTSQIDFSSAGPAADGRLMPHVCAPGYRVWAPYALNPSTTSHASYTRVSGTSFSAPAIAGVIANLQQRWKDANAGALPQCALLEAALMAHAVKPTRVVSRSGNALFTVSNSPAISTLGTPILDFSRWTDVNTGSVTSSTRQAFCFENVDTDSFNIVMRWTDVAGIEGSSAPLMNDLDMIVIGSTGHTKVVDDEINNFEILSNWAAQHTRIVVLAYNGVTTFGAQSFAIHIKGKTRQVNCTSTILPSEFSACPGESGAYSAVSSWLGATSCDFRTCPSNTCGADCARTCTLTSCESGTGALDIGGTCRPKSCPEYFFVTDTTCKCRMGTARPCSNGQVAKCLDDGSFSSCPESSNSVEQSVSSSDASVVGYSVWVSLLLICMYFF